MARWIHVKKPFDYRWPDRSAITAFTEDALGDQFVKDEIADFAVGKGYAAEGKADEASRSTKGARSRKAPARETPAATTADTGSASGVGHQDLHEDGGPADGRAVDDAAG